MQKPDRDLQKRKLCFEDMWRLVFVSSPATSPDGEVVVFARYTSDRETGAFRSRLYTVPAGGGEVQEIAALGASNLSSPAFSPAGKTLAFLSDHSGEKQIWLLEAPFQGQPRQLTTLRHGVEEFTWSPDGSRIAFTAPLWPDETLSQIQAEMTIEERRDAEWQRENMPVVIERLMYKFDETFGIPDGSCRQVGVVAAGGGDAAIIARLARHFDSPAWSPDGKQLAFYGYPYDHHKAARKEIFLAPATGGEIRQLTKDSLYLGDNPVVFTADGGSILHAGLKAEEADGFFVKLYRLSLADGAEACLFPEKEVCHGVDPMSAGKSVYGQTNPAFQLSRDGKHVYFLSGWNGFTHIFRLNLEGEPVIEQVTKGKISVRTFCTPVNNRLIYTRGESMLLDEVFCLDLMTGQEKRLTTSNNWLDEIEMQAPVEMWVDGSGGTGKIHGYVLPPASIETGQNYPAVLDIHGGPEVYYTAGFWFEFQMLSSAGMAVIYCDPRGSAGYGREFAKSEASWGDESYDDLMAFVDAAIARFPEIDPHRLGVTGGSYGGLMTNRIIMKTDRFKAAVTQRTFANQATSYGTGDVGFVSSASEKPKSFADYMFNRARRSAVTKIDNLHTPLLLLHGEMDYRCTMEQSEQIFVPLKDRHPEVPVRMVIFPGENHDLTRTGKMHFQIRHLQEMADWFVEYLGEKEDKENG